MKIKSIIALITLSLSFITTINAQPVSQNGRTVFRTSTLEKQVDLGETKLSILRTPDPKCDGGSYTRLIIDGPLLNAEIPKYVEAGLSLLQPCVKGGQKTVALISEGGLLYIGAQLGQIFRDNNIHTLIPFGNRCASSCAVAFIGGTTRAMAPNSEIMFHMPYEKSSFGKICVKKTDKTFKMLTEYYTDMLGQKGYTLAELGSDCHVETIFRRDEAYTLHITTTK